MRHIYTLELNPDSGKLQFVFALRPSKHQARTKKPNYLFFALIQNKMNIDWDQELAEYFNPKYLNGHKKISQTVYMVTLLQGEDVEFDCSIQGYTCHCHGRKYELPMGLLKDHSKQYVKAFNRQLNMRLQALADLQNSEDNEK